MRAMSEQCKTCKWLRSVRRAEELNARNSPDDPVFDIDRVVSNLEQEGAEIRFWCEFGSRHEYAPATAGESCVWHKENTQGALLQLAYGSE